MTEQVLPGLQLEKVDDRIMTLNVGPQHPGSGHMRIIIKVDGDYIVHCDPDPGLSLIHISEPTRPLYMGCKPSDHHVLYVLSLIHI